MRMARNVRRAIPRGLKLRPTLTMFGHFYLEAYFELASERLYEGGPIPILAIHRYADVYRVSEFTRELLTVCVCHLDDVQREIANERGKEE